MEIPKATKPPGYAIKISLWQRLVNWYWNMFYLRRMRNDFKKIVKAFPEVKIFDGVDMIEPNQKAIDRIYNQLLDRQQLQLLPPIYKYGVDLGVEGGDHTSIVEVEEIWTTDGQLLERKVNGFVTIPRKENNER